MSRAKPREPLTDTQSRLVSDHFHLCDTTARHLARRLPACVDQADLVQAGAIGLMDAARRFKSDHERGASFSTYCRPRITGAMIDFLRETDWVPRLARQRGKVVKLGSIDRHVFGSDRLRLSELLPVPGQGTDDVDERDALDGRLAGLPRNHRDLLLRLYLDGNSMREAGDAIGFSESRVSQLHAQAVGILKALWSSPNLRPLDYDATADRADCTPTSSSGPRTSDPAKPRRRIPPAGDSMPPSPQLQALRGSMAGVINGDDLKEVMQAQVQLAKAGDMRAAAFVYHQAHKLLRSERNRVVRR